jgi:hypothetical protein
MVKSVQRMRVARSIAVGATIVAVGALALIVPSAVAHRPPDVVTTAATDVGSSSATLKGVVTPNGIDTTYFFQYGTSRYDAHTALASAGDGREPFAVSVRVENLRPETTYHVRLVAFSRYRIATGDDVEFATQASVPIAGPTLPLSPLTDAPSLLVAPPPILGETVNVAVRSGTVTVEVPEGGGFVPLSEFASVPVGSLVNTRRGSVRLRSAVASGGTQAGIFHGGLFEVRQPQAAGGLTELALRGRRPRCRGDGRTDAATIARKRRPRRALWGNVRHGNFRTRGGDSVATVRGTVWYVEDRCDGTLTRVRHGSVRVRDLRRHRTVVVRAGHSYLARAKR